MSPSLPDPYINEGEWDGVQRNFDALLRLLLDTGGLSLGIRVGSATVTFTASTTSSTVTVPHGLGRAPAYIGPTPITASAIGVTVKPATVTATSFDAQAFCTSALSGSLNFYWVAIG